MFMLKLKMKNSKVAILLNLVYRPPNEGQKEFQSYFKNTF